MDIILLILLHSPISKNNMKLSWFWKFKYYANEMILLEQEMNGSFRKLCKMLSELSDESDKNLQRFEKGWIRFNNENAWVLTYLPRSPHAKSFCPIVLLAWWTQTHTQVKQFDRESAETQTHGSDSMTSTADAGGSEQMYLVSVNNFIIRLPNVVIE